VRGIVHVLATLVALPYALLAAAFKLSVGQWIFLAPCVGVIMASGWLFRAAVR
jgi:hypothetical protein